MGTIISAQIQLTEAELKLLQTLVYQECGMFFDERRSHFLKDRLQRRLKACNLDSFYSYYRLLTSRFSRFQTVGTGARDHRVTGPCQRGYHGVTPNVNPVLSAPQG